MSIIDWFKRNKDAGTSNEFGYEDSNSPDNILKFPEPKNYPAMPAVSLPQETSKPVYTVGNDSEGNVVLTVNGSKASITVTMNQSSAIRMIELLEVAAGID